MRKVLPPILLALALTVATAAHAAGPTYKVHVAGLACPFCAYGIEKSLSAIDGVARVETHIEDGLVIVEMAEGETLDRAEAAQAVEDAGFTLDGFEAPAGGGQ
jgi:mercuric ion binding protein